MGAAIGSEQHVLAVEYFQWMRLKDESGIATDKIQCQPSSSLSFPVDDYHALPTGNSVIHFLSLLGPSSPLPHHFNSPCLSHPDEMASYLAFMALLNRFFYRAWYAAWKSKHAYLFSVERRRYHALWASYAKTPWLARPYVHPVPTEIGLRFLLHRLCGDLPVTVRRFPHFVAVPPSCLVNHPPVRLADNAVLGNRMLSQEGFIRIMLGPIENDDALTWAPVHTRGQRLREAVRRYLGHSIQVSWAIQIASQTSLACLDRRSQLAYNAFLGISHASKVIHFS